MNERFEDLLYHAGLTAQGCWDRMDEYDRKAIEKFAELIVRDCADYLDAFNKENHVEEGIGGAELKKHFGVEE